MKGLALAGLFAAVLASACSPAQAAGTVFRCGPDGRTYSQTPCADGKPVEVADPRTPAQQAEAQRVAEREKRTAAELERQRLAAERQPGSKAIAMNAPPKAASATEHPKKKKAGKKSKPPANEDFVARVPQHSASKGR